MAIGVTVFEVGVTDEELAAITAAAVKEDLFIEEFMRKAAMERVASLAHSEEVTKRLESLIGYTFAELEEQKTRKPALCLTFNANELVWLAKGDE